MTESKQKIVYVVGAGLSAGIGFPTIGGLLPSIWQRLESLGIDTDIAEVIRFHHPEFHPARHDTYPTIEELLSELQANEDLFASSRISAGGFTLDKLSERRARLLQEIATWFHETKERALRRKPIWLKKLATAMIEEEATIISFNWDLVLDELLFGENLDKASYGLDARTRGPRLIKPHGSLNWYRGADARPLKDEKKFSLSGSGKDEAFAFRPLRAPKSREGRIYMPLIVPPVYAKQFNGELFKQLWQQTVQALSTASEVRFLGYSLAKADFHARFVLRCGFYNQENGELIDSGRQPPTGRAKVVVVDRSNEPLERIESAVGWRCDFHKMTIRRWVENRKFEFENQAP